MAFIALTTRREREKGEKGTRKTGSDFVDELVERADFLPVDEVKVVDKVQVVSETEYEKTFTFAKLQKFMMVVPDVPIDAKNSTKKNLDIIVVIWGKRCIWERARNFTYSRQQGKS